MIYYAFTKPESGSSCQLASLPGKEVVVMSEFESRAEKKRRSGLQQHRKQRTALRRYSEKPHLRTVAWPDLLAWWSGEPFQLNQSKAFATANEEHTPTAPVFLTSHVYPEHPDRKKTQGMGRSLNVFEFFREIPPESVRDIPPCAPCFSVFLVGKQ